MQGMISAGDSRTAQAGRQILDRGGNAVDAAVAAAFASFIAEIAIVHLGGSGFATLYDPQTQASTTYDFFSNMPGLGRDKAPFEEVLDFAHTSIDFGATTQDFHVGRGSVAVSGNIFGLCQLLADHGTLSLAEVLEPALELAQNGIQLSPYQIETMNLLEPIFTHTPASQAVFAPNGTLITESETLIVPGLADTLRQLAAEGESCLRSGALAQALIKDQATHGGLLTNRDLEAYEVDKGEPISVDYHGHQVLLPGPASSGGILTAFTLKLMRRFDLSRFEYGSVDHLQLLFEAMAATGRARRHWELARRYLEPHAAVTRFLNDEFVADFATEVMNAMVKGKPSAIVEEGRSPNDTSHLSVVDANGMAVSLTTTAGESAGYIVPGTGFIPNNMLGEEDLFPDGFHHQRPGTRIFTMVTPSIVLKEGKTRLVIGSGGSIRIRSAIMQVMSNVIDFALPLQGAIDAPRVHLENGTLQCEHGVSPEAMDGLEALGYPVNRWESKSMYFGGAHSVAFESGGWIAAGDARRSGSTA